MFKEVEHFEQADHYEQIWKDLKLAIRYYKYCIRLNLTVVLINLKGHIL